MSDNPIDIYVIGTGMVGTRQLTRESEAALEESEEVYLVHDQALVEQYIDDEYDAEVVDLTEEYEEGRPRIETYEAMAESVLEAAETADAPVTLALYGHPLVFVAPSRWVVERAPDRGLTVDVRPGISAADAIYCDLNLDPAANGIQMFEATDLLLREFELNPEVGALIWQIGAVETAHYDPYESKPERFDRFERYLQQFYPDDHEMKLVETATYPITESQILEFELQELGSLADQITALMTLYIPPVGRRSVQNEELRELVQSEDHLEAITTDDFKS